MGLDFAKIREAGIHIRKLLSIKMDGCQLKEILELAGQTMALGILFKFTQIVKQQSKISHIVGSYPGPDAEGINDKVLFNSVTHCPNDFP